MRVLFTVLLMLFVFTANHVAVAFEHCDDPACAVSVSGAEKKNDDKKDMAAAHCSVVCHLTAAMPQHATFIVRNADSMTLFWAESRIPDSVVGEGLIEPPSLA